MPDVCMPNWDRLPHKIMRSARFCVICRGSPVYKCHPLSSDYRLSSSVHAWCAYYLGVDCIEWMPIWRVAANSNLAMGFTTLRHMGKPLGATFIGISILVLMIGVNR